MPELYLLQLFTLFVCLKYALCEELALKGPYDVCEWDTFNATCLPGEVIIMQSAMFGRMSLGACISEHVSRRNCDTDVLNIMDGFCSGLNNCLVRPIDQTLINVKPCKEYVAFLRASYTCIKGDASLQPCYSHSKIIQQSGYLSSSLRLHSGLGTSYCPWLLEGPHRLNITLYKFVPKTSALSSSSSVCFEIGTIQEGGLSQGILTCGTDPRVKTVFLTKGGPVRLHFKDNNFLKDIGNFVLHFKAIGCGEPEIQQDAQYQRSGDTVTVTCNKGDVSWQLTCENGLWAGEPLQCSKDEVSSSVFTWIKTNTTFSLGLLGLVTLCCAVLILGLGFCLYVTHFYLTGKHKQNREPTYDIDYKLQTMARAKPPPSVPTYERTTSLYNSNNTLRKNTDYQRMNPIDPETASHHSYVLYDHVPKPLPPIPIDADKKQHIYESPLSPAVQ